MWPLVRTTDTSAVDDNLMYKVHIHINLFQRRRSLEGSIEFKWTEKPLYFTLVNIKIHISNDYAPFYPWEKFQ